MLSIIIPTLNERENVVHISDRIASVMGPIPYEILFIDDSRDDTPRILEELASSDPHVRFLHRTGERGLGTAVIQGFQLAEGDVLSVMDADLQHPPEMLVPMLGAMEAGVDMVLPSRFIPGGDDGGLNFFRKVVSAGARWLGKLFLKALRGISDPTGGFFMFRKRVIRDADLAPVGWKILIEILVKGKYESIVEMPYRFRLRNAGASKMSLKEQWNYLCHLKRLVAGSSDDRRFILFTLVGLSGVVVNMLIYILLVHLHVPVVAAGALSAASAMVSNFILNDCLTWADSHSGKRIVRFLRYTATSLVGIGMNILLLILLHQWLGLHYITSNLLGIIAGTLWNYSINHLWTWQGRFRGTRTIIRRGMDGRYLC